MLLPSQNTKFIYYTKEEVLSSSVPACKYVPMGTKATKQTPQ